MPTPCGESPYNRHSAVFVINDRGRAAPARFDVPTTMNGRYTNSLVNATWDGKTRRLRDFVMVRGQGDCGGKGRYAWDGSRFRLVEAAEMDACRGSPQYITTWRARVEPR